MKDMFLGSLSHYIWSFELKMKYQANRMLIGNFLGSISLILLLYHQARFASILRLIRNSSGMLIMQLLRMNSSLCPHSLTVLWRSLFTDWLDLLLSSLPGLQTDSPNAENCIFTLPWSHMLLKWPSRKIWKCGICKVEAKLLRLLVLPIKTDSPPKHPRLMCNLVHSSVVAHSLACPPGAQGIQPSGGL